MTFITQYDLILKPSVIYSAHATFHKIRQREQDSNNLKQASLAYIKSRKVKKNNRQFVSLVITFTAFPSTLPSPPPSRDKRFIPYLICLSCSLYKWRDGGKGREQQGKTKLACGSELLEEGKSDHRVGRNDDVLVCEKRREEKGKGNVRNREDFTNKLK